MTHDPEFPFVVRYSSGDEPLAKFRHEGDAQNFADKWAYASVTNTTPEPTMWDHWLALKPGQKFKISAVYMKVSDRYHVGLGSENFEPVVYDAREMQEVWENEPWRKLIEVDE